MALAICIALYFLSVFVVTYLFGRFRLFDYAPLALLWPIVVPFMFLAWAGWHVADMGQRHGERR